MFTCELNKSHRLLADFKNIHFPQPKILSVIKNHKSNVCEHRQALTMSDSDSNEVDLQAVMESYDAELTSTNDSESEESDEPAETNSQNPFDTDLPTTHKYLGKLNNVSGYTLLDEGEVLSMLAIHTNTLVFPGFTLPLVMHSQYENAVMQKFIETKNMFVLVCADESYTNLCEYGVTMEIFETTNRNGVLCLKARGRQRCQIVRGHEIHPLAGRLQKVTVRILPEPQITSPLANSLLLSLKLRKHTYSNDFDELLKNYKYRRYHLAQYPHSSWIYDKNEVSFYVKYIIKGLAGFYVEEHLPKDPIPLSYWFVQNFQLTHEERLKIMKLNSSLERLRLELRYLKMRRSICCGICKVEIAQQSDVFAMSKDGLQSNYCNPGGHVYETVTVSKAKNFQLIGEPSRQFSWFPGYAWTIMQCKMCKGHLGWQFTSKSLNPPSFYGLAKSGFDIKIIDTDDEEPNDVFNT